MTMITPSYLGETIEYSSLHACRSTLEDPTFVMGDNRADSVDSRSQRIGYLHRHAVLGIAVVAITPSGFRSL